MANDKISDIANKIALGENKYKESQLLDVDIKAGQFVKFIATGIALSDGITGDYGGVMMEHEEIDLDTAITAALYGDVITEGYCAVFIVNPTTTYYPGTLLYGIAATPGSLSITPAGQAIAVLERTINTGDLAAIVKLLR